MKTFFGGWQCALSELYVLCGRPGVNLPPGGENMMICILDEIVKILEYLGKHHQCGQLALRWLKRSLQNDTTLGYLDNHPGKKTSALFMCSPCALILIMGIIQLKRCNGIFPDFSWYFQQKDFGTGRQVSINLLSSIVMKDGIVLDFLLVGQGRECRYC